ncbi:hypothetical protein ABK040_006523 [Willaertia magna]
MPGSSRAPSSRRRSGRRGNNAVNKLDQLLIEMSQEYTPPPPEAFAEVEDKWVRVNIRLFNWDHMAFHLRLPESTNLYTIEHKIKERHGGSVTNIVLWKDIVNPDNEIKRFDFTKTLKDIFKFDPLSTYYVGKKKKPTEVENTISMEGSITESEDSSKDKEQKETDLPTPMTAITPSVPPLMIEEKKKDAVEYECIIYYDFTPFQSDCPLLQTSPRLAEVLKEEDFKKKRPSIF